MDSVHKTLNHFSVYVLLPLFTFMIFSKTVGVSYDHSFIFAVKIFLCDILPGAFFLRLIRPDIKSPLVTVMYAPAVGMIFETTAYLFFSILGIQDYFLFYYAVPIISFVFFVKRFFINTWSNDNDLLKFFGYNLFVFFILAACTIPYIQSGIKFWLDDDMLIQTIITKSLQNGYPFQLILSEGRSLFYNYCYHAFVDSTRILSGQTTFLLTFRLAPVFCFSVLFFSLLGFCINNLKKFNYVLAVLLVTQLFGVAGYVSLVTSKIFGGAISAPFTRVPSNTLGFIYALVISDFILYYIRAKPTEFLQKIFLLGFFTLAAFITAGTRSAPIVFIAGGIGFLFCISLFYKNKDYVIRSLNLGILIGCAFVAAFIFFYGIHTPESATNFQSFQGLKGQVNYIMRHAPWAFSLSQLRYYIPETFAGIIVICVLVIFKAGFLSFAYIASIINIIKLRFKTTPDNLYYFGGYLLTLIVWFETVAPGGSHYPYLHYTGLGASLLAVTYFSSQTFSSKSSKIIFAGTSVLLCLHVFELAYEMISNKTLLRRRYEVAVTNYTDLVGPGLGRVISYLKPHAKDSVLAISWGNAPRYVEPFVAHLIAAEAGIPILNDSRYMHSDGVISPQSPLYQVYLDRLKASEIFWESPEKAINQLYQSIQSQNKTLYILSYYPIDSRSFQTLNLEYIFMDSFYNLPYYLYKVQINK